MAGYDGKLPPFKSERRNEPEGDRPGNMVPKTAMSERTSAPLEHNFRPVWFHRLKYMMSPQIDIYGNIERLFVRDKLPLNSVILDYGCGTGQGTVRLINRHILTAFGIDSDPEVVDFAKDVYGNLAHFMALDWLETPPNVSAKYDLITCIEVIEHMKDPEALLGIFQEVIAPGGVVVISSINRSSDLRKNDAHTHSLWDVQDFYDLMNSHFPGVEIVDWTLKSKIPVGSGRTPMVAVWHAPKE